MPQGQAKTSRSEWSQEEFTEVQQGLLAGPLYCYIVMYRMSVNELIADSWSQWNPDFEKPNHFRKKEDAYERMWRRIDAERKNVTLGLLEFRVDPKYLGFVPGEDETWIA